MSTNVKRKAKLKASVSDAITGTSKIDTDVAVQCAVDTAVLFIADDAKRKASGKDAKDKAFLLFQQLAVVYSANLPVPHSGGIKDTVNKAMTKANIKPKSIDNYNQAAANPVFHTLLPANSDLKAVEYMCKIYGWNSVTAVINAFKSPLAWNEDCDAMLRDIDKSEKYRFVKSAHDDGGAAADEQTRQYVSKIVFLGYTRSDREKASTTPAKVHVSYDKQNEAYIAAEQAAQLAEQEKQTKQ